MFAPLCLVSHTQGNRKAPEQSGSTLETPKDSHNRLAPTRNCSVAARVPSESLPTQAAGAGHLGLFLRQTRPPCSMYVGMISSRSGSVHTRSVLTKTHECLLSG